MVGANEVAVTITMIGASGDGIGEASAGKTSGGRVFVPLTVPGDRVMVRLGPCSGEGRRGQVVAWLERGPDLAAPSCGHFGRCGGCTLQHLAEPVYQSWKLGRVTAALERGGLAPLPKHGLESSGPGGRRRATFSLMRRGKALLAGFIERRGDRLVDLERCPVLAPELLGLLPALRRALLTVLPDGGRADAVVALFEGGIDMLLVGPSRLDLKARQALAGLAVSADLLRLSWQPDARTAPEPVAARRPVLAWFGGVAVEVPPGAFLQASAEGEAALVALVLAGVGESSCVADLFAGCGTFSLPLATGGGRRVHAVEGDGPAMAALARAARGLSGVSTEMRDLARQPLRPEELARFGAVVFDPPRAGAAAQAAALAESAVPLVVAVSCNPATFSRDARLLRNGGYRLLTVQAVDQFLWSAHVELVAVFRR
ncbi:MAG: class I SAM-dependent RNA methyltransferase [Rhodospirillaceae bacterium]